MLVIVCAKREIILKIIKIDILIKYNIKLLYLMLVFWKVNTQNYILIYTHTLYYKIESF